MKFFINNKLLIVDHTDSHPIRISYKKYNVVIRPGQFITSKKLHGNVLMHEVEAFQVQALLDLMETKKLKKLDSVTFAVNDLEEAVQFIKDRFKMIKAAGGLVTKEDKMLMIFRLGKWDLPKGKLDKKEKTGPAALREVEEECGVKVALGDKICVTYHSYSLNGNRVMKKTTWYSMQCLNDQKMKPQVEEGITKLQWMNKAEVNEALKSSYPSISEVFQQYYSLQVQSL